MQGQLDTAAQRARPLAGVAGRRGARRRGHRCDLRERPAARSHDTARRSPRSLDLPDRRPTPACASAASASSRATPTPRSTRAGRPTAARWRHRDPAFAPEGGESLRRVSARVRRRGQRASRRAHPGQTIAGRQPRRRDRLPVPRRVPRRRCRRRARGCSATPASTACSSRRSASPWSAGATPRTSTGPARRRQRRRCPPCRGWRHERSRFARMTPTEAADEPARAPQVGDPVESIDTPALVIDLDAMERNLARMADVRAQPRRAPAAAREDAQVRDDRAAADRQPARSASASRRSSEAEALAAAGVDDIYI